MNSDSTSRDVSGHLPLIIGHRGSSAFAPENTLVSFKRAFADGAAGIEFDVRLSRDGVPVVIHDHRLDRTGLRPGIVARLTVAELVKVNVGSWFNKAHPRLASTEYEGQCLPTLDETMRAVRTHSGNPLVYVEMKTERATQTRDELVRAVVKLIMNHGLEAQTVVVSFDLTAISRIKAQAPSIRTGALFEPKRSAIKAVRKHPMIGAATDCGANEILLHRLIATRRLIDAARQELLSPVVWTVDDHRWVTKAMETGIHALITNNPGRMKTAATEICDSRASVTNLRR